MAEDAPLILFTDADSSGRIERLLRVAGYRVSSCSIEALRETAALQRPLVIVLDAQLLVDAHAGVLDALKMGVTADVPIILTSKVKREKLPPDCHRYQVFSRPVNREKLLLAIVSYDVKASGGVQPAA